MYLKLVRPTNEYAEQVMRYKEDMLANNDSFDGCAGLEEVDSFSEWIDFENRLKRKYGEGYVPSEVFLGVRTADEKVVGILTGNILKDPDAVIGYHQDTLFEHYGVRGTYANKPTVIDPTLDAVKAALAH